MLVSLGHTAYVILFLKSELEASRGYSRRGAHAHLPSVRHFSFNNVGIVDVALIRDHRELLRDATFDVREAVAKITL